MVFIIKFIKKLFNIKKQTSQQFGQILNKNQHNIKKNNININAVKVLTRLNNAGFQAYLVGGSVRDLLLNKIPKDFDIATNATPIEMRKLFRNARIIGKRFKLIHIIFQNEIVEVATFRGTQEANINQTTNERGMLTRDNVYGTITEDAYRRDFSINAIYYNIFDASLIDFANGIADIQNKLIKLIGDPITRYQEDPVRMLRAIRFAAKLNFTLDDATSNAIYEMRHLLQHISGARLFDEVTKLYYCGDMYESYNLLIKYELFTQLFAQTHAVFKSKYLVEKFLQAAMQATDARILNNQKVTIAFLFAVLLWFPMKMRISFLKNKQSLAFSIDQAMNEVIAQQLTIMIIPKRLIQIIREIWLLQFRFSKRTKKNTYQLLQHPRFRAAYDFLLLRSLANDVDLNLVKWWTQFQNSLSIEQDTI